MINILLDILIEPEFLVPLIVNLVLGFVVALCLLKIVRALVICMAIPFVVVMVRYVSVFYGLGSSHEVVGCGFAQVILTVLTSGYVACYLGCLLGFLTRRFRPVRDKT